MIKTNSFIFKLFHIKSLSVYHLTLILFISSSILSIIIISTGWVISENYQVQKKISTLKENTITQQKVKLKEEVLRLVSYLEFIQKDSTQYSQEQVRDKALQYFESLRFGNDGYVFVNTYSGNALLFNGKKLDEPKKMSDLKYPSGLDFYKTEMNLAKIPGGGSFQYDFTKLNDSVSYPKMSYIMGFDQWEWILGAGDYLDNLDNDIAKMENELKSKLHKQVLLIIGIFIPILILLILLSTIPAKFIQNQFNKFIQIINNQSSEKENQLYLKQIRIRDLQKIGKEILKTDALAKQLGNIIDSSNNDIYIFQKDNLQFAHANKGAMQHCGYSMSELQNMNFLNVLVNVNNKQFLDLIEPFNHNLSKKIKFESILRRKNNTLYQIDVQLTRSYLNEKEVYVAFIYDITERKKTEQSLINSKNYTQTIFDSSTDAIIIHDAETGSIIDVNAQMSLLFGYEKTEVIGQTVEVFSANSEPITQKYTIKWLIKSQTEGKQTFEWRAKHKDGHLFWTEVSIAYIKIDNEYRYLATVRDIDDRKKVEQELEKYRLKLEDLVKERTKQLEDKNNSLEQINTIFVGRELKMAELKKEIEKLKEQLNN